MATLHSFFLAVQFLTRVPVPAAWTGPSEDYATNLRRGVILFPLVGGLIGLSTAVVIGLAAWLWPLPLAVLLGLAWEAWLTGAFHEDAVADFCDAFGGGWTRDDVLRILKDSRVGSYGVLGLLLAVLLRATALAHLDGYPLPAALVASAALGRWLILVVMALVPPVADRPGLASDVGQQLCFRDVLLGAGVTLPAVAGFAALRPFQLIVGVGVLLLAGCLLAAYVRRRLGGVTGDALGFACYLGQLVILLAANVRWLV